MSKWCKWIHTKEIILCLWVTSSRLGRNMRCRLPSCAPYASGARSENWSSICARLCCHFRLGQSGGSLLLLGFACYQTWLCLPVRSLARITTERGNLLNMGSIRFLRWDAGWCLCSGAECDSPVETLQFYFRPSHTQWELSRNVSPCNYSVSGSREILCVCK